MSAADTMRALVWLDANDPSATPAETIVRAARPSRWPAARFDAHDVDRAVRSILGDAGYYGDVYRDACRTAERAGVGLDVIRRCSAEIWKDRTP